MLVCRRMQNTAHTIIVINHGIKPGKEGTCSEFVLEISKLQLLLEM